MLAALWGAISPVHPAHAATVTVSTCSQQGLTDAITAAGSGGTVQFTADCSITLSSTISLVQSVTIDGAGQAVTISGGGSVQVFSIASTATVTLNHLTIVNGLGPDDPGFGGGIFNF